MRRVRENRVDLPTRNKPRKKGAARRRPLASCFGAHSGAIFRRRSAPPARPPRAPAGRARALGSREAARRCWPRAGTPSPRFWRWPEFSRSTLSKLSRNCTRYCMVASRKRRNATPTNAAVPSAVPSLTQSRDREPISAWRSSPRRSGRSRGRRLPRPCRRARHSPHAAPSAATQAWRIALKSR